MHSYAILKPTPDMCFSKNLHFFYTNIVQFLCWLYVYEDFNIICGKDKISKYSHDNH